MFDQHTYVYSISSLRDMYVHTYAHTLYIHTYIRSSLRLFNTVHAEMKHQKLKYTMRAFHTYVRTYARTQTHVRRMYPCMLKTGPAPLQRHKTSSVCGIGWVSTAVLPLLKVWTWEEVRVTAKSVILLLMFCGMMVTQKSLFTISHKWSFLWRFFQITDFSKLMFILCEIHTVCKIHTQNKVSIIINSAQ